MRKTEVWQIVKIIRNQGEPEKLLKEFIKKFPKYHFKKQYNKYLKSANIYCEMLKKVYGKGIADQFKSESHFYNIFHEYSKKAKGKGYRIPIRPDMKGMLTNIKE